MDTIINANINIKATGEKIKELCAERNIKVKDIQQFIGFSCPQAIYRWFKGESLPTLEHLYSLSALLGVTMDEMVDGTRGETIKSIHYEIPETDCSVHIVVYFSRMHRKNSVPR